MATRKRKKSVDPSDLGPEIRQENGTAELDMRAAFKRNRNKIECRLDWYYDRGYIDKKRHNAGTLYRLEYQTAISQPNVTARYSDLPGGGIEEWTAERIEAIGKIRKVMDLISRRHSAAHAAIIERVAGVDQWAGPGTLWLLRDALTFLAEAWRITEEEPAKLRIEVGEKAA